MVLFLTCGVNTKLLFYGPFEALPSDPANADQCRENQSIAGWTHAWGGPDVALTLCRMASINSNNSCVHIIDSKRPGDGLVWREAHTMSKSEAGQLSRSTLKRKGPLQTKAASEKAQWDGLGPLKVLCTLKIKWLSLQSKAQLPFLCLPLLLTKAKFRRKDWLAPCGPPTSQVGTLRTGSKDPTRGELLWTGR